MATSNFKIFAEGATTIQTDAEYEADTQRQSGVTPGLAVPKLHNKLYKQGTIMAAALAQVLVEQGQNALDSDYSGLVASIKKTFLLTLNGEKPDANGNIAKGFVYSVNHNQPDASGNVTLNTDVLNQVYQIGDVKVTTTATNPGSTVLGGTWSLLSAGKYIRAAGTADGKTYSGNSTGGSNSVTLSTDNLPSHIHTATIFSDGSHAHSGSTGATGVPRHIHAFGYHNNDNNGRFLSTGATTNNYDIYDQAAAWNGDGGGGWTGQSTNPNNLVTSYEKMIGGTAYTHYHSFSTDSAGTHSHAININATGSGKAFTIEPAYLALYFWVRTA